MPQAIRTRFLPCTNTKSDRIVAECAAKKMVYLWPYKLDPEEAHIWAAKKLIDTLDWEPLMIVTGQLVDGSYVHILDYGEQDD